MTPREADADRLAEITALREHVAMLDRRSAELQGALAQAHAYLTESQEQHAATAEILRVISSSPTDYQPVFDTIVRNAGSVCGALDAILWTADGDDLVIRAHHGPMPGDLGARQPVQGSVAGRVVSEGRIVHVENLAEADDFPFGRDIARRLGWRTTLGVPLLRGGVAVGAMLIRRSEVRPFTPKEIALAQTFADQAVIAIENVRLFTELEARNRDLTTALDRQTTTAEVLRIIAQSPTELQPVLDAIAASAVRLCAASDAVIERLEGDRLYNAAHAGTQMKGLVGLLLPLTRRFPGGRAILDRRRVILDDIHLVAEAEYPDTLELLKLNTIHSVAEIPLLSEGKPLGSLAVLRAEVRPFTDAEVALLETFASQAVIAIENVRLFTELQEKNRALTEAHAQVTEALEQQTATSEVLKVISRSTFDLQPVLDTLIENAARLCASRRGVVMRRDGDSYHGAAYYNVSSELIDFIKHHPVTPGRHSITARVALERRTIHVADLQADPEYRYALCDTDPIGTELGVPMFRGDDIVGVIILHKLEVQPFTDKQIELVETFADQAVIAIENVRLFNELQARTAELGRSVDKLTALGEISRAVSSSLDLQTVLNTIAARASQLTGTDACSVYEYDEEREEFHLRATARLDEEVVAVARRTPIRKGEGAQGRMVMTRAPVQIHDIATEDAYHGPLRDVLLRRGARALLAVPLLRDDRLIGGLTVNRSTPGTFPPDVVDLLQTFAAQSALAIQNARLFREIESKSLQLAAASQHKSEFLANMSHELRTPLNAIIGYSEMLQEEAQDRHQVMFIPDLERINAAAKHQLSLINDILDLSKVEAGKMELELTDFHLPTAIDNALTLVRERATRRGTTLQATIDPRLGAVRADERKIKQVVLNLLSNAIKFTPEGGRIDVRALPVEGGVEVSVSDTGVGIAPEDQDAVFEEFRQVGASPGKQEGTGLGLTLCRKFVELHSGKIWVKSQVGAGSTFTFTIPARPGE